mmetsp:Transcript_16112/g.38281  ORF Transcript_16112/g.38281 Transcript_16112/m.38281 type:complete len:263 (+) Transcript_16112:109-897(+)
MGQRLALPNFRRKPSRSVRTNRVAAQVKMSQRLAPAQHARQPLRPLDSEPVPAQVEVRQRLALREDLRKPLRALRANLVAAQIEMRQRLALLEHRGQHCCLLCAKHVAAQVQVPSSRRVNIVAQIQMRQRRAELIRPRQALQPRWELLSLPLEHHLRVWGEGSSGRVVPHVSLPPLHEQDATRKPWQLLPQQLARSEPDNHTLCRPDPREQEVCRQAQEIRRCPSEELMGSVAFRRPLHLRRRRRRRRLDGERSSVRRVRRV